MSSHMIGGNACGTSSPGSKSRSPSPGLGLPGDAETGELLEQICTQLSKETTAELVDIANSTVVQQRMQDMLPIYFYSWTLQQPAAIIIYLLLQFFLVKRDSSYLTKEKEECETHIYELKQKIGDLEEQLRAKAPPINSESSTWNYVGGNDHLEITDYLLSLNKDQIFNLGLVLGLDYRKLSAMEDSKRFLDDVIIAWLRREDQVIILIPACTCTDEGPGLAETLSVLLQNKLFWLTQNCHSFQYSALILHLFCDIILLNYRSIYNAHNNQKTSAH